MRPMVLGYRSSLSYLIDIVLCVDATASMDPVISMVRELASTFHVRLEDIMAERGKAIGQTRIKTIAFRDFGDNSSDAIEQTDFIALPQGTREFVSFVSRIKAHGGGDIPESGLEALALAVASPWRRPGAGTGLRQIIVLFTDAPAHRLGQPGLANCDEYPQNLPDSDDELFDWWSGPEARMDRSAKRLILFAPDAEPWNRISEEWENTLFYPSDAGMGLQEFELGEILHTIANSI
jgi:hypothetical protein